MRKPTKEELKLVVAAVMDDNFYKLRLFDSLEHMKETIRTECGCRMSENERKKYVKKMGGTPSLMSKSTCYAVAKMLIGSMKVQVVSIDELNEDELKFLSSIVADHALSPVKDLLIKKLHSDGCAEGPGACGWFANAVIAWRDNLVESCDMYGVGMGGDIVSMKYAAADGQFGVNLIQNGISRTRF